MVFGGMVGTGAASSPGQASPTHLDVVGVKGTEVLGGAAGASVDDAPGHASPRQL